MNTTLLERMNFMTKKFYYCETCKKLVQVQTNGGGQLVCCGKPMVELKANSTDAAGEKHVPQAELKGDVLSVWVGSVMHPMTEEHLIQWVYVETKKGGQFRYFSHNDEPKAEFIIAPGDQAVAVYEYCNLHGLWKTEA